MITYNGTGQRQAVLLLHEQDPAQAKVNSMLLFLRLLRCGSVVVLLLPQLQCCLLIHKTTRKSRKYAALWPFNNYYFLEAAVLPTKWKFH